jgi:hypothetical protein
MANLLRPVVGNWYRHLDKGGVFQIVDANEEEDWVEVQSFEGDIEEFSGAEWRALEIGPAEQPEDWTGPYDDIQPDDLGYSDMGPELDEDQKLGEDAPLRPAEVNGKTPPEDL